MGPADYRDLWRYKSKEIAPSNRIATRYEEKRYPEAVTDGITAMNILSHGIKNFLQQ